MNLLVRSIAACVFLGLAVASSTMQQPATSQPRPVALSVSGVGLESTDIPLAKLATLPRTTLKVTEKEGEEFEYEGVRLADVLAVAGMKFGQSLRGDRLANYLIAESADGYRVVFALTELDPDFSDRVVMIADRRDGKEIEGRDGPLRIVVSDERKHARWVRNLTRLTVEAAPQRK